MSHVNVILSVIIYLLAGKSENMQVKLTHQVHYIPDIPSQTHPVW